jgi:hypothetical protein
MLHTFWEIPLFTLKTVAKALVGGIVEEKIILPTLVTHL